VFPRRCSHSSAPDRTAHPEGSSRRARARGTDEEGAGNHVDISPERDALPWRPAAGPRPGSETSWRSPPQCTVALMVLSAVLLVCLGLLLGAAWTVQALQPKLRRQAEERRRLNAEWSAIRTARRRRGECPRCASPLSERDWFVAPTAVEDPPDDDD
jgi:hypothetical protein